MEAFVEDLVELTSVEATMKHMEDKKASMEAFMEVSIEAFMEASTALISSMEASMEASIASISSMEACMKAVNAFAEAFMSFHAKSK